MDAKLTPITLDRARLLPGLFQHRFDLNRRYLMSLKLENLLQNFYGEAGMWNPRLRADRGDAGDPSSILVPDGEREWTVWLRGYRAIGQNPGLRFKPLYEVTDEPYTVYFPIQARS